MDFEKKVCFVTGGGSGIGRAVALEPCQAGCVCGSWRPHLKKS